VLSQEICHARSGQRFAPCIQKEFRHPGIAADGEPGTNAVGDFYLNPILTYRQKCEDNRS
jgi:hypothetical protein